jgi:hypothetical protein
MNCGRAVDQAVNRWSLQRWSGFETGSGHVGFVVDKEALEQDFSEYFSSPCQASHRLLHTRNHPSSGVGTIGQ